METKNENYFKKFCTKIFHKNEEPTFKEELKDLGVFLVFLFVTTIVATSSREIGMFYFNNTIERLFKNRVTANKHGIELSYEDLVTISDWWSFAESTFVHGISQFQRMHEKSSNETSDSNILLGLPRLRQIRVQKEPCQVEKIFDRKFETCFPEYKKNKEEILLNHNGKEHSSQSQVNTYDVKGLITKYRGAGYIEMLSYDTEENESILAQLQSSSWVDEATRITILEFVLFNPNINLFCNVKFLAEFSATGGVVTSYHYQALKYNPLWNDNGYFVMFCSVVFFGLIFYYTIETIRNVLSGRLQSCFDVLLLLVLAIAYVSLIYISWHTLSLKSALKKHDADSEQFISLDIICYWNSLFIDLMALSVFIVWIHVYKFIKFNKTMMQFSITLQRCSKDLLGFSVMFAIVFMAFALLGVMLFGTIHSGFCDVSTSVLTLLRTVLGDFDFEKLEEANRVLGPTFFISFILFVFFILMNMFLAIINDTYSDVKSQEMEDEENKYEEYIKLLLGKIKNFIFPSLKKKIGGGEKTEDEDYLKKNIEKVNEIEEPPVSEKSNTPEVAEKDRTKEIDSFILKYFELLPESEENICDKKCLSDRITVLEEKLETIITTLDKILTETNL